MFRIPYAGSEFERPEIRGQQVSDVTYFANNEFTALKTLTRNRCRSTPTLLDYKKDRQDDTGLVPGGFMLYLLMNELSGVRLTDSFRNFPAPERDQIWKEFRAAWEYVPPPLFPRIQPFSGHVLLLTRIDSGDIGIVLKLGFAISKL